MVKVSSVNSELLFQSDTVPYLGAIDYNSSLEVFLSSAVGNYYSGCFSFKISHVLSYCDHYYSTSGSCVL